MSNHIYNAQKAANRGASAPNTSGLSKTQQQQAQKAYEDQKAKNAKRN